MTKREQIRFRLSEHLEMFRAMEQDEELLADVELLAEESTACLKDGGRILMCGNGGSASDAQHIAAEFVGRFQRVRKPYDVEALNINVSSLTAISNDYGFEEVFARQVEAKGRPGDLLIGFSTSGTSPNVVKALERGKAIGMRTVLFTGDHMLAELTGICDRFVRVPSKLAARIQEGHIWIGHMLAELVEDALTQE
jgi:D-sedoheptulose 7-phosphate isomerase